MSNMDRVLRLVIAIIVTALYFNGIITGTIGILLLVLSGIFLLTSLVSFCPLYAIFGISTCKVKEAK